MNEEYDENSIVVLEGLEAVRKRPSMYIGSTSINGVYQIIYEVIDNSIDEALAGFCNKIDIKIFKDGTIQVSDNGRGIPIAIHPQTKKSSLETVMTVLHAGGKFGSKGGYKISGGLHGVGVSCTNALSEYMSTQSFIGNESYIQEYHKGIPQYQVKKQENTIGKEHGTVQTFKPDTSIFPDIEINSKQLLKRIREQAYLTGNILFTFQDERSENYIQPYYIYFEGGAKSYVRTLDKDKHSITNIIYLKKEVETSIIEVAMQYTTEISDNIMSFANNIYNPEGGTHITGFKTALTKTINDYSKKIGLIKDNKDLLTGEDVREGLTAIISVKLENPQFEGQTKMKLNNSEMQTLTRNIVAKELETYLEENPKDAKNIIDKVFLAAKARKAAKAARDSVIRKSVFEGGALPGKLSDCSEKDPDKCELFIVEGDSAGGSAKQARDRQTQAILPITGKPINSEKYRIDKVLENDKLKDFVVALGTGISDTINVDKIRYKKIIIMADADVDGEHIATLLLTFLYRHLKEVLEKGYVYIAQPPLYKITTLGSKEEIWALDDNELSVITKNFEEKNTKITGIQRYKGLGEMNSEQLWQTTMNPESRVLKQINIDDFEEADKTFEMLMGTEVPPRKKFIQLNAKKAEIDI
jgi:DNA gyrase subunit B